MPTLAEIHIDVLSKWLALSSVDRTSPAGDSIPVGPYAELVTIGLDDALPVVPSGCLALFTLQLGYQATYAEPHGQPSLSDRAKNIQWLSTAQRDNFPAFTIVRIADGQTIRQAIAATQITDLAYDRLIVGLNQILL